MIKRYTIALVNEDQNIETTRRRFEMFALSPFRSGLTTQASRRSSLTDIDDIFNRLFWSPNSLGSSSLSNFDMYEKDGKLFLSAEAPGINPDDVEIRVSKDRIQFKSKNPACDKEGGSDDGKTWYSKKTAASFGYDISLPLEIETDKAEATFENGVISIIAPRLQASESRLLTLKKA
jgi:HSP20 family protein